MNKLEKHFKIRERGSSVRTEVLAGMTTFATMAYIIILQPVNMRDTAVSYTHLDVYKRQFIR